MRHRPTSPAPPSADDDPNAAEASPRIQIWRAAGGTGTGAGTGGPGKRQRFVGIPATDQRNGPVAVGAAAAAAAADVASRTTGATTAAAAGPADRASTARAATATAAGLDAWAAAARTRAGTTRAATATAATTAAGPGAVPLGGKIAERRRCLLLPTGDGEDHPVHRRGWASAAGRQRGRGLGPAAAPATHGNHSAAATD